MFRARSMNAEAGVSAVIVAISLTTIFAFVALAIDLTRLYISRNELKNVADAAALAAAASLYADDDSGTVNTGANEIALSMIQNVAGLSLDDPAPWTNLEANTGDIQRGHWSFSANRFYRSDAAGLPADFFSRTGADNDQATTHDFVNAVMVRVRRETNPLTTTFANMWGFDKLLTQRISVAWLGYAGSFAPWELDAPIAICKESLVDEDGVLSCTLGRMMPSTEDTAKWTNFTQDQTPYNGESTCGDPATASPTYPGLRNLIQPGGVCRYDGVNAEQVRAGFGVSTTEGELATVHAALRECWQGAMVDHDNDTVTSDLSIDPDSDGKPDYPWKITLPVIDCQNPGCNKVVGAVAVEVMWITVNGSDPNYDDIPVRMWDEQSDPPAFWTCDSTSTDPQTRRLERIACVNDFFDRFNLHDGDGNDAYENPDDNNDRDWLATALYFRPDCDEKEPTGTTGGENYGILADTPVLVDHLPMSSNAEVVLENQ